MDSSQIQTSTIKNYQAQVYDKTSDLLTVFQKHIDKGCTHCLSILKSGLRPITTPDADDGTGTIPEPTRNDQEDIR